jgi:hypothetical protein
MNTQTCNKGMKEYKDAGINTSIGKGRNKLMADGMNA